MAGPPCSDLVSASMFDAASTLDLVLGFDAGDDGLAAKSRELIVHLLRNTEHPFSRDQFSPGHITGTALVLSPDRDRVLLMMHHRHRRWLLPGGHVELTDASLAHAAKREAIEETGVVLIGSAESELVGMDVHGIPPKKGEPYHLHYDLVFSMSAEDMRVQCTEEAPEVAWCAPADFARHEVPLNIVRSFQRAIKA